MAASLSNMSIHFEMIKILGGGRFSIVYLVEHPKHEQVVFKKLESSSGSKTNQFTHESDMHMRLNHPNIVKCLGVHCVLTTCGLFLEYMTHGTVVDLFEKFTVTWQWKMQIINDVAQAMSYLHDQQPSIIHGDLKPQNILINKRFRAKVSDFGLSCFQSSADNRACGTLPFVAPECLENAEKCKTEKFDVYSFAITVWEILSEKKHLDDFTVTQTITTFVIDGQRPSLDDITSKHAVPDVLVKLVKTCWNKHEQERPTFQDIWKIVACELTKIGVEQALQEPTLVDQEQLPSSEIIPGMNQPSLFEPSTERPKVNIQTEEDFEQFVKGFKAVSLSLTKYIDSENGLLRSLTYFEVLSPEEYQKLNAIKSYKDRNDEMIQNYIEPRINGKCKEFVEALKANDQEHIVKYIMCSGQNRDEDRLLSYKEIQIIDNNMFGLVNLINPYKMEFLYRLVTTNCITSRHKEKVEFHQEFTKKVDELLTILKRRCYRDLCIFKKCLHDTMQNRIAKLLESSGLVAIRVELEERPDRQFIESALIAHMTNYVEKSCDIKLKLTEEQNCFIDNILKELEDANVNLIGSSTWRSMAVFFMCSSENSQQEIQHKFESGKLKEILEQVYRTLYKLPECCPNLIKSVSLHKLPLQNPDPFSDLVYHRSLPLSKEQNEHGAKKAWSKDTVEQRHRRAKKPFDLPEDFNDKLSLFHDNIARQPTEEQLKIPNQKIESLKVALNDGFEGGFPQISRFEHRGSTHEGVKTVRNKEDFETDLMVILKGGSSLEASETNRPDYKNLSVKSDSEDAQQFSKITNDSGCISPKKLRASFYGQIQKCHLPPNTAIREHGPAVQLDLMKKDGSKIVSVDLAPHFEVGRHDDVAAAMYVPKAAKNNPNQEGFLMSHSLQEKEILATADQDGGCRKKVLRSMKISPIASFSLNMSGKEKPLALPEDFNEKLNLFHDNNARQPTEEQLEKPKQKIEELKVALNDGFEEGGFPQISRFEHRGSTHEGVKTMRNNKDFETDLMVILKGGSSLEASETNRPDYKNLSVKSDSEDAQQFSKITNDSGCISPKKLRASFYGQIQNCDLPPNTAIREHGPAVQLDLMNKDGSKIVSVDLAPHFEVGRHDDVAAAMYVPKAAKSNPNQEGFLISHSLEEKEILATADQDGGCRKKVLRSMKAIRNPEYCPELAALKSSQLKTAVLEEMDHHKGETDAWAQENVGERFVGCIKRIADNLDDKKMSNYFMPDVDTLELSDKACENMSNRLHKLVDNPEKFYPLFEKKVTK